jgi:hypothetical protein
VTQCSSRTCSVKSQELHIFRELNACSCIFVYVMFSCFGQITKRVTHEVFDPVHKCTNRRQCSKDTLKLYFTLAYPPLPSPHPCVLNTIIISVRLHVSSSKAHKLSRDNYMVQKGVFTTPVAFDISKFRDGNLHIN